MFRTSPVHHQERFYKLYSQIWYVLIRALLDKSSRFEVVGRNLRIQLVKKAPDDGPVRSETCRANISDE